MHPEESLRVFAADLGVGSNWSPLLLSALIGAEFAICLSVLMSPRKTPLIAAATFLLIVTVAPLWQLYQGSNNGCGCGVSFGLSGRAAQLMAIVRNLSLVAVVIAAVPFEEKHCRRF